MPFARSLRGLDWLNIFLAAVALAAFGIFYFFMPETRDQQFQNATP
jgi:hypothetical protein